MNFKEMSKRYTDKYAGVVMEDYVRDIDSETAKTKYLLDEYNREIASEFEALKNMIKNYFDTKRMDMNDKSEQYALEANNIAHNLVHDVLVVWNITEGMIADD